MAGTANQIRIIQVAIRDLGLAEEEYRALYEGQTGKRSLKEMTVREMGRVLDAMVKLGFERSGRARARAGKVTLCGDPQPRKIRSLWLQLRDLGVLRNPSEQALLAYVKRLTHVDRMEWLSTEQLSLVIESLKSWVGREMSARGLQEQ